VALVSAAAAARVPPRTTPPTRPQHSPWQSNRATYFVQGLTDLGVIYTRPRVMLGYGAPHWQYVALDAFWVVTNSFTAPYVGWRASLPFLDAMLGVRTVYPYNRELLAPRRSHTGPELGLDPGGERSTYSAIDFELAAYAPLLHGVLFLDVHPVCVDAPREQHLYEEMLRAVMRPPFAVGLRGGYMYGIGPAENPKVGVVAEYVLLPGRPGNVTRAGPIGLLRLSRSLELMAAFSAVADSPDSLGIWHGPYAFIGFTHRWAERL